MRAIFYFQGNGSHQHYAAGWAWTGLRFTEKTFPFHNAADSYPDGGRSGCNRRTLVLPTGSTLAVGHYVRVSSAGGYMWSIYEFF